ncbi:hypothetical protein DFQ30_005715, partial [Apophysomyces sp. BC1015]
PPAATAVHRRNGAAGVARPRRGTRREAQGAALAAPDDGLGHRAQHRTRSVHGGRDRRRAGQRLCRGGQRAGRQPRGDIRRAARAHQQLALGQRAVLPAHRQADAETTLRDRHRFRRPAVLDHPERAAQLRQPAGHPTATRRVNPAAGAREGAGQRYAHAAGQPEPGPAAGVRHTPRRS